MGCEHDIIQPLRTGLLCTICFQQWDKDTDKNFHQVESPDRLVGSE